jgi:hypothetical protein
VGSSHNGRRHFLYQSLARLVRVRCRLQDHALRYLWQLRPHSAVVRNGRLSSTDGICVWRMSSLTGSSTSSHVSSPTRAGGSGGESTARRMARGGSPTSQCSHCPFPFSPRCDYADRGGPDFSIGTSPVSSTALRLFSVMRNPDGGIVAKRLEGSLRAGQALVQTDWGRAGGRDFKEGVRVLHPCELALDGSTGTVRDHGTAASHAGSAGCGGRWSPRGDPGQAVSAAWLKGPRRRRVL